jgi:hypothetical protein
MTTNAPKAILANAVHIGRKRDVAQCREVAGTPTHQVVEPERGMHHEHTRMRPSTRWPRDLAGQHQPVTVVGEILRLGHSAALLKIHEGFWYYLPAPRALQQRISQ